MTRYHQIGVVCLKSAGVKRKWYFAVQKLELLAEDALNTERLGKDFIGDSHLVRDIVWDHSWVQIYKKTPKRVLLDDREWLEPCFKYMWDVLCEEHLPDHQEQYTRRGVKENLPDAMLAQETFGPHTSLDCSGSFSHQCYHLPLAQGSSQRQLFMVVLVVCFTLVCDMCTESWGCVWLPVEASAIWKVFGIFPMQHNEQMVNERYDCTYLHRTHHHPSIFTPSLIHNPQEYTRLRSAWCLSWVQTQWLVVCFCSTVLVGMIQCNCWQKKHLQICCSCPPKKAQYCHPRI